jgi:uncharacterized lipoprotein YmbA
MSPRSIFTRATAAAFMFTLVGCMSQPYKGQMLFGLQGGAASASAASAKPHAGLLRVRAVSIAQPYGGLEFSYRYMDGRMRSDPYGGFISSPQALMGSAIIDRLGRERVFDTVSGPELSSVPAYELIVSIAVFGAVYEESSGKVELQGTAYLVNPTTDPNQLVATFDLSVSAEIQGDAVVAVAQGMNDALSEWIAQLAGKLRTASVPPLASTKPTKDATK